MENSIDQLLCSGLPSLLLMVVALCLGPIWHFSSFKEFCNISKKKKKTMFYVGSFHDLHDCGKLFIKYHHLDFAKEMSPL